MAEERLQRRSFAAALEVRAADPAGGIDEGRLVCGQAVPYDEPVEILDFWSGETYMEEFRRGAFAKTIDSGPSRVKFYVQHQAWKLPSGHARVLEERTRGLYVELYASRIERNEEVMELIRDGTLRELSIGFVPIKDRWNEERNHVVRQEVKLREVSIVPWGAYADSAEVVALRERVEREAAQPRQRPNLDEARTILARFRVKV